MSQSDKTPDPGFRLPDPALVSRTMADVAERSQRIVADFIRRQGDTAEKLGGRPGGMPPQQFSQMVERDRQDWGDLIRSQKLQLD